MRTFQAPVPFMRSFLPPCILHIDGPLRFPGFISSCCESAGPGRIAGYEDLIEDAALELERINSKIAAARNLHERVLMQQCHFMFYNATMVFRLRLFSSFSS